MSVIDRIRLHQARAASQVQPGPAPRQQPEMLYIGCVDARLDPIDDIGIAKGMALIFRNIGALVMKEESEAAGILPQNVSLGAVLEFFLSHIQLDSGAVKHIVVSGHTDCGGLKACQQESCGANDRYLPEYLTNIVEVRDRIRKQAGAKGWNEAQLLRAFEEESVRQSVRNLHTYPVVREAVEKGRVALHGWVIDTATQRIAEMHPETLEFQPMG